MNVRECVLNCLNYRPYERLSILHFGFWKETWQKWWQNDELPPELRAAYENKTHSTAELAEMIGFDSDYADSTLFSPQCGLMPPFEERVLRTYPDGSRDVLNSVGVVVRQCDGVTSIPAEIDHVLKDRSSWEKEFLPRLQFVPERVYAQKVRVAERKTLPFAEALDFLRGDKRDYLYGLYCGSLIGRVRDYLGVENLAYLQVDDEALFDEIIKVNADLCFRCVETALATGARFDYAHFWEDICFKNGPLISPAVFAKKIVPHYRRITDLLRAHGITIISVDCDGLIDALVPHWLASGVNTMFPIEVGTWQASIASWRQRYGKELRGVGGMNKTVFAKDRAAVDDEIARLKELVELGGYIPCPDHRIPPDAKFELVQYYCQRMREVFPATA